MKNILQYGARNIGYDIKRSNRKTLAIHVHPDLKVVVAAPYTRSIKEINVKVNKRASWIVKQLSHFGSLPPAQPAKKFLSGETHRYLGKQYRIRVKGNQTDNEVKLKGGWINISLKSKPEKNKVEELLNQWYKAHAKERFTFYLDECYQKVKKFKIAYPKIYIRSFEKRWGSCSKKGHIYLNLKLIKQSPLCIQYVIMHELCHLKYHNHGKMFYELLGRMMPEWEIKKKKLEMSEI